MKTSNTTLILFFLGCLTFAQTQKYTLAESVNGIRSNLAVKTISQFSWIDEKTYIQSTASGYLMTDITTMKQDTLISLSQLNNSTPSQKKWKNLPALKFVSKNKAYFSKDGEYQWLQKTGNTWAIESFAKLPKDAENETFVKDHGIVLFTQANNLFYQKNGKSTQITNESNPNIICGQAVHRNEFGIDQGYFPAPNAEMIAFYRMDQSMVKDYPIIDWTAVPAENKNIKYPMAGSKSHEVTLGVYNIKIGTTKYLKIEGDKEQYLTAVSWSPDSKFIFVGVLNRGQNQLMMNMYDAATGNYIKTIFEEKSEKYVEPQHPISFLPNSSKDFLWQSQRTGFNHLFLYNIDRGLVGQLTKGDWLVTDVIGFNEKKKEVFFASTKESPLERHLYKVSWIDYKMQRLDSSPGMHNGILNKEGTQLYDVYSNENTPRVATIINTQNLKSKTILVADNPLKNYHRPEIKNITLSANDGTPLYGKLILPTDFDPTKKYPTIVYLYNGPHVQLVTNSFPASGNLWYEYMAQRGYIVFTMDGRGSSNRGVKFEQEVFRNLGSVEMKDQMKGVEYLKSLSFVDSQRMGVHGWSFGGFMTTSLMLKYPEVFKAAVAGGPVIDWSLYEIMYTERYMDTPKENPEGYAQTNLLDKVQNLKGKLLMIHGAQDDVVVWQHSMKFIKAAVDQGIQIDYFVYPGHQHNVLGKDRVHLMQKVTHYFDEWLKK